MENVMSWWSDSYRKRETPTFWWLEACRLKRAAELCRKAYENEVKRWEADPEGYFKYGVPNHDLELMPVSVFLYALAFENLLRGALIDKDPTWLTIEKKAKRFHGHAITKLVGHIGLNLDQTDHFIVKQLETAIRWRGRYPTPKKQKDWALTKAPGGTKAFPGQLSPEMEGYMEVLYLKLENLIKPKTIEPK